MAKPASQSDTLTLTGEPGKTKERSLADATLDPLAGAVAIARSFSKPLFGDTDISEMYLALHDRASDIRQSKLTSIEDMLMAQAAALNAIFCELARRSGANMGEYLDAADRYMRLALKAQGQCRATLEVLATVKNPPLVYARQATIAAGPQQVNNGTNVPAGAAKHQAAPNELLESEHGKRLEPGAEGASGDRNPQLAPLDARDRPSDASR